MKKFIILIPVYNDWKSVSKLLNEIDFETKKWDAEVSIIIVNDASLETCSGISKSYKKIKSVKIINMKKNKGHARCNAAGLKYISQNEDIDYVADSTSLYVRWNGFTDNQSIHYYEASIGSLDDTTNIATWQKSLLQDNIQIMDLDLDRGVQYFAYLRAIDSATNISSVIKSDGVEFDNVPPEIKSISPLFDSLQVLSVTNTDQIKIDFNKPILKFGLDIISTQDSTVNYELTKRDSGITISILDILPSYEMLSVMLDTAIAFNLLNYSDTIIFRSKLWGDLNNDYKITVEDVLAFNQAWPYSSTDLGPFLGDPPYIYPSPDNQFNLKDLIAFGKMWMWYYHENNSELYTYLGVKKINKILASNGRLAIWSAGPDLNFEDMLKAHSVQFCKVKAKVHQGAKRARHLIYVIEKQ